MKGTGDLTTSATRDLKRSLETVVGGGVTAIETELTLLRLQTLHVSVDASRCTPSTAPGVRQDGTEPEAAP